MFKNQPQSAGQLLSDHSPFVACGKNTTLIGWNILCQMQFNPKWEYFNNGFNCRGESDDLYSHRLSHLVSQIGTAAKIENPDFICLQECPEKEAVIAKFDDEIRGNETLKKYEIERFSTDGCSLITLYNTNTFSIEPSLSHHIATVPLHEGLAGRILPLVFLRNDTRKPTLVINVHANFSKTVEQDIKALYARARELGIKQVALLGDFNRDLVLESDDYSQHDVSSQLDKKGYFAKDLQVKATAGASFCSKFNKETKEATQRLETRDGILSTFPVEVACMMAINTVVPKLRLHKALSPDLNRIPDGLLEPTEPTKQEEAEAMRP
jgi:endonuclease/exonuclease/phosphatase family metal-dependent hydrolase